MDNSVKHLIALLEPLVFDLDDQKKYLREKQRELDNVSRMLAYTKDNLDMVGIYADQDLIIDNLEKVNSNKEEYRACCYLLKSDNEKVKQLPQYKKAYSLINSIIEFFKQYKVILLNDTQDIEKKCRIKEIDKKYYDIFTSNNPYIDNIQEFIEFLDYHELSADDRINILIKVLNNNINEYTKKSN